MMNVRGFHKISSKCKMVYFSFITPEDYHSLLTVDCVIIVTVSEASYNVP